MKILWVSHRAELGGAELALAEGVDALTRYGHAVHVVIPKEGTLQSRLASAASVQICHHNPWVTSQRGMGLRGRWLLYDLAVAAPEMTRIIRRVRPDVVISNTITTLVGAVASRWAGTPHVWFLHEFGAKDHGLQFLLGERPTMRAMNHLADRFIVNSETLRRHFAARLPERKLDLASYAVELPEGLARGSSKRAVAGPFRLVLVGRKTESKGQHEAVAAMAILASSGADVRLDLVGEGDREYEAELRRSVRDSGIEDRVRFFPFTAEPQLHVAESDAALMCSRSEAFGRVTIEAMKLGKPVIATSAGANLELIRHGWNGYLYQPGHPGELAQRIAEMSRQPAEAQRMGAQGQAWANSRFNLQVFGGDLQSAIVAAVEHRETS